MTAARLESVPSTSVCIEPVSPDFTLFAKPRSTTSTNSASPVSRSGSISRGESRYLFGTKYPDAVKRSTSARLTAVRSWSSTAMLTLATSMLIE